MTKYRVISYVDQDGGIFYELQRRVFYIWTTMTYGWSAPERAIARANEYIEIEELKRYNKKHEGRVIWSN